MEYPKVPLYEGYSETWTYKDKYQIRNSSVKNVPNREVTFYGSYTKTWTDVPNFKYHPIHNTDYSAECQISMTNNVDCILIPKARRAHRLIDLERYADRDALSDVRRIIGVVINRITNLKYPSFPGNASNAQINFNLLIEILRI